MLKRSLVVVIAAFPAAGLAQVKPATAVRDFQVEAAHSSVGFSIGFLGFPVRGRFDELRGTVAYDARDVTASSIAVAIPVKGLSTGSKHRDEHLLSSDFFDAARFPYIVFQSKRVTRTAGGRGGYAVTGSLAMHGVTREVTISFRQVGTLIEESHGSTLVLFAGAVRVNRKDFGIVGGSTFNPWFDQVRSATMADSVDITLDIQGWDPDYARNTTYDKALARIAAQGMDSVLAPLQRMHALNPDTLKGADWELTQIGAALLVRGHPVDALKVLGFSASVFPKSSRAQSALAHAQELTGDRDAARATVRRALEADPYDTWAITIARRLGVAIGAAGSS
jgi:polyisoprenoid-binding protein YceI